MEKATVVPSVDQSLLNGVLGLRPRLRRNIRVVPQRFRGSRWYLLQDQNSGAFIRLNNSAYELIGRFDGKQSIGEILERLTEFTSEPHAVGPDQVVKLIAQLHDFEALDCGLSVSLKEALGRFDRTKNRQWQQRWGSLLSMRFSLLDPDRFLNALMPLARKVLSTTGLAAWLVIVSSALLIVFANQANFNFDARNLSFGLTDVATYVLLYCAVKALHELGHGLAIKRWGGEVHDAGVTLLVFVPVPYVDGSASLAFKDKRKRALVGAAGILVELLLAAIGVIVWAVTEPGLVNDLALKVVLIGGLSTLLYNGNPLLRFDGYFVLEDLSEIPNLSTRSSQYYVYLFKRYALGLRDSASPVLTAGERPWFSIYGVLSPVYRLLVLLGIAVFLAQKYLIVGVVVACVALYKQLIKPTIEAIKFLIIQAQEPGRKPRTVLVLLVPMLLVMTIISVPVPLITRTQGVVWVANDAQLVAETGGVISAVHVTSGSFVEKGDVVLQLSNPVLETDLQVLKLKQSELLTSQAIAQLKSRVEGEIVSLDHDLLSHQIDTLTEDQEGLVLRSPASGVVVFNDPHDLQGKFVREGDLMAFVVRQNQSTIRTVIDQGDVGNLDAGIDSVEIMLASQMGTVHQGRVLRNTPSGGFTLPSAALGQAFGGPVRTDPSDGSGLTADAEIFQIDLELPDDVLTEGLGGRAFVKLHHGTESLAMQWGQRLRQLVLARLTL